MVAILFRTLLIYFSLYAILRIMGKRQIGELEITDLVTTLLLSEIASLPITNSELPVSHAIIPMITLLFLEIASSVILIRFPKLRILVSARPTVIIHGGVLDQGALEDLRISLDELISELRQQGIPCISLVECAILEKNGKLTVFQRAQRESDDAPVASAPLSHIVYSNDSISQTGLSMIGKDADWLRRELASRGVEREKLFCVMANEEGEIHVIEKQSKNKKRRFC